MIEKLKLCLLLALLVAAGCSQAEDVRNEKPLSDQDKQYLKQMDDQVADEEKSGGG